ncbi:hypothetical protein [Elizabethkingia anophelis]|uniref:hypothetical protein n=1 Tax=Elizabethkingia anophelis TaxID=1117645 RepID=UPI0037303303
MIETYITISVNRKTDIDQIQDIIIKNNIQFPVYFLEYGDSYQINFTSDYEEWELDTAILKCFPEYEYTTVLGKGGKEIRIQISRHQSEFSTDGWGRPIENPLNEKKYLVKKSANKIEKFNPEIKVLFENQEQYYYVNIIGGIDEANKKEGFLLLDDFKAKNEDINTDFLKDRLHPSPIEAFHHGYNKIQEIADTDFNLYLEKKKKKNREIQKLPRKIIRDFINACNQFDEEGILKSIHKDIVFEKRINYRPSFIIEGITAFKEYLSSSEQQLCNKSFKIRSSWSFNLPTVRIGVKYFPTPTNQEANRFQKYEEIEFVLQDNTIIQIVHII